MLIEIEYGDDYALRGEMLQEEWKEMLIL